MKGKTSDVYIFAAAGTLYCVYSGTSGDSTYVTLYNVDGSVTNPTTYQFSCMVRRIIISYL